MNNLLILILAAGLICSIVYFVRKNKANCETCDNGECTCKSESAPVETSVEVSEVKDIAVEELPEVEASNKESLKKIIEECVEEIKVEKNEEPKKEVKKVNNTKKTGSKKNFKKGKGKK